jgi:hypothetical protein
MAMQETEAAPEAQPIDKLYMRTHFCLPPARCFAMTPSAIARSAIRSKYRRIAKRIIFASSRTPTTGDQARSLTKFSSHLSRSTPIIGGPCSLTCHSLNASLMRLVGRKEWGGKDSEELSRALYEIRRTAITAFFNTDDRYIERDFNIFNELYFERRNSYTDPIELCRVTIAEPIIQSLRDLHFTCLNHFLMRRLGCPPLRPPPQEASFVQEVRRRLCGVAWWPYRSRSQVNHRARPTRPTSAKAARRSASCRLPKRFPTSPVASRLRISSIDR